MFNHISVMITFPDKILRFNLRNIPSYKLGITCVEADF